MLELLDFFGGIVVAGSIVGIATYFVINLLKSTNKKVAVDNEGVIRLKMHPACKNSGIMFGLLAIGCIILGIFTVKTTEDISGVTVIVLIFMFLGGFLFMLGKNCKAEVDDNGIVSHGMFGKTNKVLWKDVISVSLRNGGSIITVSTFNEDVSIFIRLVGVTDFVVKAMEKLEESQYSNAFGRLYRLGVVRFGNANDISGRGHNKKIYSGINVAGNVKAGARWFYWIAGLSLLNSVVYYTNTNITFILGLGITQIVDGVTQAFSVYFGTLATIIGISINLIITGIFVLFGYIASKGKKVGFILGLIIYGLDTLILIGFGEVASAVFHVFAIVFIFKGLKAINVKNVIASEGTGQNI